MSPVDRAITRASPKRSSMVVMLGGSFPLSSAVEISLVQPAEVSCDMLYKVSSARLPSLRLHTLVGSGVRR